MKYKIKEYSFGRIEDREILYLKDSVSLHHFFYSENSITTISIPVRFNQKKYYDSTIVIPFGNNDTALKYINVKGDSSVIFKYKGNNSYTYDSLGRLIRYSYSSCFECGRSPYTGFIQYNNKGQIRTILNTDFSKARADFHYTTRGRLKSIIIYDGIENKKNRIAYKIQCLSH